MNSIVQDLPKVLETSGKNHKPKMRRAFSENFSERVANERDKSHEEPITIGDKIFKSLTDDYIELKIANIEDKTGKKTYIQFKMLMKGLVYKIITPKKKWDNGFEEASQKYK